MASIHPIHRPDATYGQPEVHYPSEPTNLSPYIANPDDHDDPDNESLAGETKGDETTAEEWAMSEEEFEKMVLTNLGIKDGRPPLPEGGRPRHVWGASTTAYGDHVESVLLPLTKSTEEEKELHEKVMANLRRYVTDLEEEEMFESSMGGAGGGRRGIDDNAAGLAGQLRPADVRNLLRANVNEVWNREKERSRERERNHQNEQG